MVDCHRSVVCVALVASLLLSTIVAGEAVASATKQGKDYYLSREKDIWNYRKAHRHQVELLSVSLLGLPRTTILYMYFFRYDDLVEPLFDTPGTSVRFWAAWALAPHLLINLYVLKGAAFTPGTVTTALLSFTLACIVEVLLVGSLLYGLERKRARGKKAPSKVHTPKAMRTPTAAQVTEFPSGFVFDTVGDSRVAMADATLTVFYWGTAAASPVLIIFSYLTLAAEEIVILSPLRALFSLAMVLTLLSVAVLIVLVLAVGSAVALGADFPTTPVTRHISTWFWWWATTLL